MIHTDNPGDAGNHQPQPKMDLCEISRVYGHGAILAMRDNERPFNPDDYKLVDPSGAQIMPPGAIVVPAHVRDRRISFLNPVQAIEYVPSPDLMLVGDCHVVRGSTFVKGGESGIGKSRSITDLAVAGALGPDGPGWFGLRVHRRFRTMIIQTENGRHRIRQEYLHRPCADLKDWILISEPPPFGLTLAHPEFRQDMAEAIASFKPDCVILDPWNAAAKDDKQRDYSEAFDALLSILPLGDARPALGIVAHTRKPQPNEKRVGGTGLKNILAGSHVLTSVPRCVFVMIRASEDESDDRVVFCNPKNNDGALVARTAWRRTAAGYVPVEDFDWEEFENPSSGNASITINHLREVFDNGTLKLELSEAVSQLALAANVSESHAYKALGVKGKFAAYIRKEGKIVTLIP
ncbi:MAG TPA: AAA family ATPase [Chthoniobacteraceae bacterium]|nr:AAA family ATPase [Chthoniobacteraceae bacterium]